MNQKPENKMRQTDDMAQEMLSQPDRFLSQCSASKSGLLVALIIVVCIAVLTAHWPALSAEALSFDDDQYLTDNLLVQNPSLDSTAKFLTEVFEPSTVHGYYQPLAMISLMLDHAMGGRADNLRPFHRTSLALHIANTALVIVLLYLLFGQLWIAAAVGLLFGLHPMTVEPIPWIGERKTLLAAFFSLWCLVLYVRFANSGARKLYLYCILMYLLALMSKPTSTPLPLLMLLMDYWPLRRMKHLGLQAFREKIPFFVIGAISAVITYISQIRTVGIVQSVEVGPLRIPWIICHNIIFYPYKMLWPTNLSSHYPFPMPFGLSHPMVLAGLIGTCILIILVVISLRFTPGPLVGCLFFFIAILPTMQIIGFSKVIASDKFAYLPSVGFLILLTSFLCWFCNTHTKVKTLSRSIVLAVVVLGLASAESVATRRYLVHWRDSVSLYQHMLLLAPNAMSVHNNLGVALARRGDSEQALEHFSAVIEMDPTDFDGQFNTARTLTTLGKLDQAIEHYKQALRIKPYKVKTYTSLGFVLGQQGKLQEAVALYHRGLDFGPADAPLRCNLGVALIRLGRLDEAVSELKKSLELSPDLKTQSNLAYALALKGQPDEAVSHYRQILWLAPNFAGVHHNLSRVLESQGKLDEAAIHYRLALKINPNFLASHYCLANILSAQGKFDEAIKHYRQVLRINPDYTKARQAMEQALTKKAQTKP